MPTDVEKVDPELFKGKHNFLVEELLMPNVNKTNCSRTAMWNSHINQAVVLDKPEFPRIFTNFENAVGEISSSYKTTNKDLTILHKITKNSENYILVVKGKDNTYDVIERKPCERITEHYGWKNINDIDQYSTKKNHNIIKQDSTLYRSTAYDEDLNFNYGTNLMAAYMPYKNLTFEDAVVISQSGIDKLDSYTIKEYVINVNKNDILLNLYGNTKVYKSFPDIGEIINDRILLSRRRIDYDSFLYDMSVKALMEINYLDDKVFYTEEGDECKIVDIDVYSNTDIEVLAQYRYNSQLLKYLKMCNDYYEKVIEVLEPIVNSKKKYSDDLAYTYKRAKDIMDPEIHWMNDMSNFDNLVLKIKVLKREKATIGSKLTGR